MGIENEIRPTYGLEKVGGGESNDEICSREESVFFVLFCFVGFFIRGWGWGVF